MVEKQQAFVEACAQIIPVLVVALLADPIGRKARVGQSGLILFALIAGLFGEMLALLAVGVGTDATTNKLIVISMLVLSLAIIAPHAAQHWGNVIKNIPPRWRYVMQQTFYYVAATPFILTQIQNLPAWARVVMWIGLGITAILTIRYDVRKFRFIRRGEDMNGGNASDDRRAAREEVPSTRDKADDPGKLSGVARDGGDERDKQGAEK